jgi:predicted nucleic acid-binding protein
VFVLGASALVDLLLDAEPEATWVAEQLAMSARICAPHHLELEVVSAIRRGVFTGKVPAEGGLLAVRTLAELPVARYPVKQLLERIFELRDNLTAYDAAYIALAEALDIPLVTTDRGLARSPGHAARVIAP